MRDGYGYFLPTAFIVTCDSCGDSLDLCGPREGDRKFDLGDGVYRCLSCQDITAILRAASNGRVASHK